MRSAVLAANLALLACNSPTERGEGAYAGRLTTCLQVSATYVTEVLASAEARSVVETKYLAGHPALFPDEAVWFADQIEATKRQTVMAMRLAELDGLARRESRQPDAVAARADTLVGDLVEPAKVTTLAKLGDGRRALSIATRWLQGKANANADPPTR